jgi:hypothetical protein
MMEEVPLERRLAVCTEKSRRRLDSGVEGVPVAEFVEEQWGDALV